MSIISLISLFVVINFFETVDEFIIYQADPADCIRYYLFKIPQIFFLMVPNAILLATIVSISSFSQNNELTAMRAGGISLLSITKPILLVSFFVTLFTIVSNEFITPFTNQKSDFILKIKIRKGTPRSLIRENKIWYHAKDQSIWNIDYLDPKNDTFKGVHIYFFKDEKILTKRLDASYAAHDGKYWIFEDVYVRKFDSFDQPENKFFKKVKYQFVEIPSDFYRIEKKQKEMSLRDIHQYRQKLRKEGLDPVRYDVDFHYKISYPFVCVIMALIGIPFSLKSSRSGGIFFSCGLSIIIGFIYYYLFSMSISLGHGGTLPPWLSAWGVNIIAVAIGFYMLLTIDSNVSNPVFKKS